MKLSGVRGPAGGGPSLGLILDTIFDPGTEGVLNLAFWQLGSGTPQMASAGNLGLCYDGGVLDPHLTMGQESWPILR